MHPLAIIVLQITPKLKSLKQQIFIISCEPVDHFGGSANLGQVLVILAKLSLGCLGWDDSAF